MRIKRKFLIPVLSIGLLLMTGIKISCANEDNLMNNYYSMIRSGKIKPPQYEEVKDKNGKIISHKSLNEEDWIKSIQTQKFGGVNSDTVFMSKDQKHLKIQKMDQNGKPIKGVVFKVYDTKEDAKKEYETSSVYVSEGRFKKVVKDLAIDSATTNEKGEATFDLLFLNYNFYLKEVEAPDDYKIKKDEIIHMYRDNGVRFLGEVDLTNLEDSIKAGEDKNNLTDTKINSLNSYLLSKSIGRSFFKDSKWLLFNDNGVEKLVSKKPLSHSVSWNEIYYKDFVFGENPPEKIMGNISKYKPQYVKIGDDIYVVRLMRGYNDSILDDSKHRDLEEDRLRGSEWDRLMLPLIKTEYTEDFYQNRYQSKYLKYILKNMPTFAYYRSIDINGNIRAGEGRGFLGTSSWVQEINSYQRYRTTRNLGGVSGSEPYNDDYYLGWRPVLEKVGSHTYSMVDQSSIKKVDVENRLLTGFTLYDQRWTGWVDNYPTPNKLGTRIIGIDKRNHYLIQRFIVNPEGVNIGKSTVKIKLHEYGYGNIDSIENRGWNFIEDWQVFDMKKPLVEKTIENINLDNYTPIDITKDLKSTKEGKFEGGRYSPYLELQLPSISSPILIDIKIKYRDDSEGMGAEIFWDEGKNISYDDKKVKKSDYYSRIKDIKIKQ